MLGLWALSVLRMESWFASARIRWPIVTQWTEAWVGIVESDVGRNSRLIGCVIAARLSRLSRPEEERNPNINQIEAQVSAHTKIGETVFTRSS